MVTCPRCQHRSPDRSVSCSRCGEPTRPASDVARDPLVRAAPGGRRLGVASGLTAGSAGGGIDEYQRIMAERAAKQRRNRVILLAVAVVGVGAAATVMVLNSRKAKAAQAILDAGGRFAARDRTEVGAFWNCITSGEVDVGSFKGADEIQKRIEGAYFMQQKTFSDYLSTECVPKIERGRSAMGALASDFPAEIKDAFDRYLATLPRLQSGIESYADKVKGRSAVKDVDGSIQEVGTAFSPEPTVESVAFEKFLVCAIPDLDHQKDIQGVLEFLASTCKNDAARFMTRVREQCGPIVQNLDKNAKPVPSKTFKANAKKLYEEDQRQLQAWEYCGKRSRKVKKALDLDELLNAAGDYLEARSDVAQATRDAAARALGQPVEASRK